MNPQLQPRPTIKDIARACGVSEATVSYVLNGKRVLKPDTRERVFRVMREMNYHPSAVARGLSSKKVNTIGILFGAVDSIEFVTNAYASGLLKGIMICAQREGFDVTFFTAVWKSAEVSAPPLRDGRTDGILAIAPTQSTDILPGVCSLGMPLVVISADPGAEVANVDIDNRLGALLAVRHLVQLGHKRIAYLMGNEDLASFTPRRRGYLDALAEAEIPVSPGLMVVSHFDGSMAFEQASKLLRQQEPPTAIFAGNDSIALGVIEAARCLGVQVPSQLSVVGFDDAPAALMVTPNLTTVRQPLREIGETATQLLIQYVREPETAQARTTLLPPELVVRGSTAPVSR
jgi:LacI family transcriptional regulator